MLVLLVYQLIYCTVLYSPPYLLFLLGGVWIRNLTQEGIEPNPGPSWNHFVEAMKQDLEENYEPYQGTLSKRGLLYWEIIKWKETQGKKFPIIDLDQLFEFVSGTQDEMELKLGGVFRDDIFIIGKIIQVVETLRQGGNNITLQYRTFIVSMID